MNRVHKTLWSESAQCWQAVPETAKAAGKRSVKSASGGVLATVVMGLALSGGAGAQSPPPPATTQLPMGGSVVRGSATISQTATAQAAAMTVNQSSQRAIINWDSFNLGTAASINFVQPNAQAVTLNRVNDHNPSQIFGRITSNGQVFLSNPSGVYFSPTASVDVGALVATTHSISDAHFMAGNYQFERNGATGKVVNEGRINAALGGYVALLAPEVQNAGVVLARAGTVALAAGEVISLQVQGGGLAGITTTPSAIQTLIENKLAVQAPDGQIILSAVALNKLQAGVIKNSGSLEANSLVAKGGKIYLEADDITLAATSKIEAKGPTGGGTVLVGGDWQGSGEMRQATKVTMEAGARIDASATDQGDGGKVVLWSDIHQNGGMTRVNGSIKAEAGPNGGDGGKIETSGHFLNVDDIQVSTQSAKGSAGEWLLDPYNITISSSADASTSNAANTFTSSASGGVINTTTLQTALASNNVTVSTAGAGTDAGNITIQSPISWSSSNTLTLTAAGVVVGNGAITMGTGASVIFNQTGHSGAFPFSGIISGDGSFVKQGVGNLVLTGANSYTGTTTISAGSLLIGNASVTTSSIGTGNVINNGTLYFQPAANATMTVSGNISGSGAIFKLGGGVANLSGNNTYTGSVTAMQGTLRLSSATAMGAGPGTVTVRNGVILELAGSSPGLNFGSKALDVWDGGQIRNTSGANTYGGVMSLQGAATITVDTGSSLNLSATGADIAIAAGKRLTLNLTDGNLTIAKGLTGGSAASSYLQSGSGVLTTGTITSLNAVRGVYIRLSDPTGTDYSSTYGNTPDYTFDFFNASTGTTRVALVPADYTLGSLVWTTTGSGTSAPTASSNAGTYAMTYASGLTITNTSYSLVGAGAATNWTVNKAPLTVTANNAVKTYGDANPTLTVTVSGFKNSQTLATSGVSGAGSATTTATASTGAGAVAITAGVGTLAATNYDFSNLVNGTLTINKAPLTVTANNAVKTYGDANPTLTATVSGFVNGETLATSGVSGAGSATTTATATTGAGAVAITAGVGTLAATNYDFSNLVNGTLTINKAPLTVTANNAVKTYGDANPTLSATVSGFVNGETLATSGVSGAGSATTTATATTGAGAVAITAGVGTLAANNYDFSNLVNGTLTINKAPLTVTANNAVKTYGDANPTLTATVSGFVNGETLATSGVSGAGSATTTATAITGAGAVAITAGVGTLAATNYDFSNLVNGTLTIQAAAVADSDAVLVVKKVVEEVAPLTLQVTTKTETIVTATPPPVLTVPEPPGPPPDISIAPQTPVVSVPPTPQPPPVDALPVPPTTPEPVVATLPSSNPTVNVDSPDTPDDKDKPANSTGPRTVAVPNLQGEQVAYLRPAEVSAPAAPLVTTVRTEPPAPPVSAPTLVSTSPPSNVPATPSTAGSPASAPVAAASPESPRSASILDSVNAPASAPAGTGVLAITILRSNNAQPSTAGVAFEQNADTVSLRATDAPPLPASAGGLVITDRMTTFMVASSNGEMVAFQGSLMNNRMVIVAPSLAAKQVAQTDMNNVLVAAVKSLSRESRVILTQLDGVVLDLR